MKAFNNKLIKIILLLQVIGISANKTPFVDTNDKRELITSAAAVTSSAVCKNLCVDKLLNFCPTTANFNMGTCCSDQQCVGKVDICSYEASSMRSMQYQACPKESWCGNYYIKPTTDGKSSIITPKNFEQYFHGGAMCTYQVLFPNGSGKGDKLSVQLMSEVRSKSKFMVALNYRSNKYQEADMISGTDLSIGYPYKVYLNVVSTGKDKLEPTDFKLNITYVKFDANAKEPVPQKEDRIIIQNKTITTKIIQKDLWESGDFVIIISVAVAAIIFIIILIACLVFLKIKGEKMSKVEKFNSPGKQERNTFGGGTQNNAQVKPSSKPNFGDDDEEGMEFVGSQNPSHLFKSQEDQAQFMEFFKKLQAQQQTGGKHNTVESNQSVDAMEKTQVGAYKNSPGQTASSGKKQNYGVMQPATIDYKYDYEPQNDPMGLGGNNDIAQARREAAAHGYKKVSNLSNFQNANSGLGALQLPPLQKNTQLPSLK